MGKKCFVDEGAFVADTASVDENTEVFHQGRVEGYAEVVDVGVFDDAVISGNASALNIVIFGTSRISGNADVELSRVEGAANIYGRARVYNVDVYDSSSVFDNAKLFFKLGRGAAVILKGDCKFGGDANFDNLINIEDFTKKYGTVKVSADKSGNIVLTDVWDMGQ